MDFLSWAALVPVLIICFMVFLRWMIQGPTFESSKRLDGKTAAITGANTGIGLLTAQDLARRGARVLILCRNKSKGQAAVDQITAELKNHSNVGQVEMRQLDLSKMKSIRECAGKILKDETRLDLLVLNAGVMMSPIFPRTEDGFEMQIGTNHLGHFLLTRILAPLLRKTVAEFNGAPRVVVLSSAAHFGAMRRMRTHDINFVSEPEAFSPIAAYSQSKMANVHFARELGERLKDSGITTYSLHPGVIDTELSRHGKVSSSLLVRFFEFWGYQVGKYVIKTPWMGAQNTLYCCLDDGIANQTGRYYDALAPKKPSSYARNREDGRKLWEVSEELTGCKNMKL